MVRENSHSYYRVLLLKEKGVMSNLVIKILGQHNSPWLPLTPQIMLCEISSKAN